MTTTSPRLQHLTDTVLDMWAHVRGLERLLTEGQTHWEDMPIRDHLQLAYTALLFRARQLEKHTGGDTWSASAIRTATNGLANLGRG